MITAQQLFERWLELKHLTETTEMSKKAFTEALVERHEIENDLHNSYHLLLAWDNDAKEWFLVDVRA